VQHVAARKPEDIDLWKSLVTCLIPKNSIKHFPLPSIDVEVAFFMMMDTVSIFSRCLIELNVVISTSTTSSSTGYSIQVSLKSET
jgi:hypothetical protein